MIRFTPRGLSCSLGFLGRLVVILCVMSPASHASPADVVLRMVDYINTNDKDGFLSLLSDSYSYNGERNEDVLRYFFVIEGGRRGHSQTMKLLRTEVAPDGRRAAFEYENCLRFAPLPGDLQPVATVCGGGHTVIESGDNGKITAVRPVSNSKKMAGSTIPTIDRLRVNGQAVDPTSFQTDIHVPAGRMMHVSCRITGTKIDSVSLVMGSGLATTHMQPSPVAQGIFEGNLPVSANAAGRRYFVYIKPYTSDYQTPGAGALRTVTVPVMVEPLKRRTGS